MSTEVVKVQRPLASSGGERLWLIYDVEKEHIEQKQEAMISSEIRTLMGNRDKIYLLASWTGKGWVLLPQEQIGVAW